jgi:uncharacterized C2H2 Zn-finger protein
MVQYTCERCKKEFKLNGDYTRHCNRKYPCKEVVVIDKDKIIEEQKNLIEDKDILLAQQKQIIHDLELLLKEKDKQLDKFIAKTGKTTITNNVTATTNNTINLTDLGSENVKKLSLKEKFDVLNSGHQCYLEIINAIHNNKRFPEYNNIAIKNLRADGGHEFQCGKWYYKGIDDMLNDIMIFRMSDINELLLDESLPQPRNIHVIKDILKCFYEDNDLFEKKYNQKIKQHIYNFSKNIKIK